MFNEYHEKRYKKRFVSEKRIRENRRVLAVIIVVIVVIVIVEIY